MGRPRPAVLPQKLDTTAHTVERGTKLASATTAWLTRPGTITSLPANILRTAHAATGSASMHVIRAARPWVSIFSRHAGFVRMPFGHRTLTLTGVCRISARSARLKFRMKALDGAYTGMKGIGKKAAMLATFRMKALE